MEELRRIFRIAAVGIVLVMIAAYCVSVFTALLLQDYLTKLLGPSDFWRGLTVFALSFASGCAAGYAALRALGVLLVAVLVKYVLCQS